MNLRSNDGVVHLKDGSPDWSDDVHIVTVCETRGKDFDVLYEVKELRLTRDFVTCVPCLGTTRP